ncbi:MAG: hypothetical protein K2H46_02430 [Muribaculaceae bacterium]|nr:hypothetical protein [Muribaculaceae bacterium]
MGIKSTITYSREDAIYYIREALLKPYKEDIEYKLSKLSNKELEDAMEEHCESEFFNYEVVDKVEE